MDFSPRSPLQDPSQEDLRTARYWAELEEAGQPADAASVVGSTSEGGSWVLLSNAQDADFEAWHMRHSIGHSWDKYSSIGSIHGLRSKDGIPQVTALEAGGAIIHAREARNARLSASNMALLEEFCRARGWMVQPEAHPFEIYGGPGRNTCLRFLVRDADNEKTMGECILPGVASIDAIARVADAMDDARYIPLHVPGSEAFSAGGTDEAHEIMSMWPTDDAPTTTTGISEFIDAYAAGLTPADTPAP
jgi:hypothetical protein